tara:strand:- start:309 stop:860 length:552 start_codon:yes stop_codon:yes gene_type:complete
MQNQLSILEVGPNDIHEVVHYFHNSTAQYLKEMGADKSKLPEKEKWLKELRVGLLKPDSEKSFCYLYWMLNGQAIGHCNINNIQFANSAKMHLHLWDPNTRQKGMGQQFVRLCLEFYFKKFKLQSIICEPFAENIAPNRTLLKVGFSLLKTYYTIPGKINFHQKVNRFEITNSRWEQFQKNPS